jgi:hypothetical protein
MGIALMLRTRSLLPRVAWQQVLLLLLGQMLLPLLRQLLKLMLHLSRL